jgi:hypothetical protein
LREQAPLFRRGFFYGRESWEIREEASVGLSFERCSFFCFSICIRGICILSLNRTCSVEAAGIREISKNEEKKMKRYDSTNCAKVVTASATRDNDARLMAGVIAFLVLGLICSNAFSSTIRVVPNPADLYDLDHEKAYTWGIDRSWSFDEAVASATLSFDNIRNWDNNPNVLYIHLLDTASLGVRVFTDNQAVSDYFNGQGTVLTVYRNLPATAQDLSYSFNSDQIAFLNTYATDGRFGLGFDPDCHFYNSGVSLELETASVPEPATMVMVVLGGVSFFMGRKSKHFAR